MTGFPKPTWEPLLLRCGPCGHGWQDWQPSNCAPDVWIAQMRSLRCPKCGAKRKLFMRSSALDPADEEGRG